MSTIITDVKTVKEFLEKYYKSDRYTGRGEKYAEYLLLSHQIDLMTYGYDAISHHDSNTGKYLKFYSEEKFDRNELEKKMREVHDYINKNPNCIK